MPWYVVIKEFFYWVGALSGAVIFVGLVYTIVKKPFAVIHGVLKQAIKETIEAELKAIHEKLDRHDRKLDILCHDITEMKYCEILDFMEKIRTGKKRPESAWTYILQICDEYEATGQNGKIKAAAEFLREEYKKRPV